MKNFAKLFTIGEHQVVAYKDFENKDDDTTSYRIITLVGVGGSAQQVTYGYKEEEKRDARFEELDEAAARLSLSAVLEIFGE